LVEAVIILFYSAGSVEMGLCGGEEAEPGQVGGKFSTWRRGRKRRRKRGKKRGKKRRRKRGKR
jgi:hypothetical protein